MKLLMEPCACTHLEVQAARLEAQAARLAAQAALMQVG
jgi:hypothetical protein